MFNSTSLADIRHAPVFYSLLHFDLALAPSPIYLEAAKTSTSAQLIRIISLPILQQSKSLTWYRAARSRVTSTYLVTSLTQAQKRECAAPDLLPL